MSFICIRGAKEHNLKNLSLDLPRDQLIVITGPSGSGKSSLAFDTLYAEGQRRYVDSLSSYARQFLDIMKKPDVDSIDGLSPAISIEQKTTSKNPRSTVATVTEIYDYLRLLYARVGVPISPKTGKPITAQTISQMVDQVLEMAGGKIYILAPFVRKRKGEFRRELVDLQKRGFSRVWVDGELCDIDNVPLLDKNKTHTIHVLIDRLKLDGGEGLKTRLAEAFEMALKTSPNGLALVQHLDENAETLFSSRFACPESGFTIEKLEPRLFSFNSPVGACPVCNGLGVCVDFDLDKIIPDPTLSLEDGAIAPWTGGFSFYYLQILRALAKHYDFSVHIPFENLPQSAKDIILYGSGREAIPMEIEDESRTYRSKKPFEGLIPMLKRRFKEREKAGETEDMNRWHKSAPCPSCDGKRLKPEALCVHIHRRSIGDAVDLSIQDAQTWFAELPHHLTSAQNHIAERILKEICDRLSFLNRVGVGYLHLSRVAGSLSGGEAQRIRLASQIGAGLVGVLYVLDEPSIGLHQRDNARLIETLKHLKNLGNTVIVVEHDEDTMRACDYLVDMGPAAGAKGGEITAEGSLKEVLKNPNSLTADYLSGRKAIDLPQKRRDPSSPQRLSLKGATLHNLNNVSVDLPLGCFIGITGVSGSGKSSLIIETLYPALAQKLNRAPQPAHIRLLRPRTPRQGNRHC